MRPTLRTVLVAGLVLIAPGSVAYGVRDIFGVNGASAIPHRTGRDRSVASVADAGEERSIEEAWMEASEAMGFGSLETAPDENDENVLNHAIWYGTMGFDRPYPGEPRVLRPEEVPRATAVEPEEED